MRPNPLMLLRIAQGDAYAAAVEYKDRSQHKELYDEALKFEKYLPVGSKWAGRYTDDSQMSIAVAETLLGDKHTHDTFIDAFVRCFKRDPRDGYARGFQAFLEGVKDTDDFIATIRPNSDKNGAAMRAVPIGVLPTPEQVLTAATENAMTTHNTPIGIWSSKAVALMSHFALYINQPLIRMGSWMEYFLPGFIVDVVNATPTRVAAPDLTLKTVQAVYHCLMTGNYRDAALKVIEISGDTDTVLAIVFGIGSARWTEELPPAIEYGLEDGPYGRRFLIGLGERLMAKYCV